MKRLMILSLSLIMLLVMVACDKNTPLFTESTFPKIDGSTALYPLSVEFAKETIGLSTEEADNLITHNTTHNAYVNLINKKADIILASGPSDEELQLAKENGVELELIPFAKDAFVFIVNKKNKVDGLTLKEIQDIYQGNITNWRDVGGDDEEIIAYQRPKNSGSQTTMEKMVMRGLKLMDPPTHHVIGGMGETLDHISDYDNAENSLGYSFRYYATTMYPTTGTKLLALNGVKPTAENIADDSYLLSGTGYIVIRSDEEADSDVRRLIEWILSDDGQRAIDRVGYVPLNELYGH